MTKMSKRLFVTGLDASVYVLTVTVIGTAVAATLSLPFGGSLTVMKAWLFVFGWLLVGYATVLLWPRTPKKWGSKRSKTRLQLRSSGGPTLQETLERVPPLCWYDGDAGVRLPTGVKLYIASGCLLLVSFLMERALGVGA